MAKIPFTLEAWLKDKSQRVETRDGRPVKIVSFELTDTNDCPIAAQFRLCAGTPVVYLFDENGKYRGEGASNYDLFIVTPEPELTNWQTFISGCLQKHGLLDCGAADRIAKECSAELLDLARKELNLTIGDYGQGYSAGYIDGKKDGKAEALKDLPRWKKLENGACGCGEREIALIRTAPGFYYLAKCIVSPDEYLLLSDLEKLPKED